MLLAGIDLETTGLDVETLSITEAAVYLYDTRLGRSVATFSSLIKLPKGMALPADCAELSNLDDDVLLEHGGDPRDVLTQVFAMLAGADAGVAHNATLFERKILERVGKQLELAYPARTPWIDTAVDVDWGPHIKGKSLTHIAADHGFVNPFPHEAGPDVLTMLKVLSHYNIVEVLENATTPKVMVQAVVEYDDRDKAKAAGFRWDVPSKRWLKTMRVDRARPDLFEFPTRMLGEARA